jgi:hypothetical protein
MQFNSFYISKQIHRICCCCLFFVVVGFELRAYTLSHSTSPNSSLVARITGLSHQHWAVFFFLFWQY